MMDTGRRTAIAFAIVSCLLVGLPFLFVRFPPITDLPQHSAQIKLFLETLADRTSSPYTIQWFTPYSLSYLLIGVSWFFFGAEYAGRAAMLIVCLLWVVTIHLIAVRKGRSPAAAVLASVFALNHVVYWGFYGFAVGWPAFGLWLLLTDRPCPDRFSPRDCLPVVGAALLLYLSHVLWFIMGVGWYCLRTALFRDPPRGALLRGACLIPLVLVTAVWYPVLSGSSMSTPPIWVTGPFERLGASWLTDAALGGLTGPVEYALTGIASAWVLLGIVQNRKDIVSSTDWGLVAAAGMFLLCALCLPDKYMNTIRLGQRWVPPAMIMLVLGFPVPALRPVIRNGVAMAAAVAFAAVTTSSWLVFERVELSGLKEALAALPQNPRLVGLDLVQTSEVVKGRPFIQVFAYSQVFNGGLLNFSFAEFSPCLVVYKDAFLRPWTGGLEWFPQRLRESDLRYFDHALVNGTGGVHAVTASNPAFKPVTTLGRWRLYRIEAGNTR
ncbi:MAG: hypothetical protein V2B18_02780 [Pseudomonadota bacterium]